MERRSPVDSWLPEGFIGLLKVNNFFFFFLILRLLLQCLKQVLTCCGLGPCCFAVLCFPLCYTCTLLGNLSFLHLRWLCRCRIIEYSSLDPQGSSSPAPDSRKYLPKIKVCVWECCPLWEETPISVVLGRLSMPDVCRWALKGSDAVLIAYSVSASKLCVWSKSSW